jgi:cob(I)alamin adenosyltransferase
LDIKKVDDVSDQLSLKRQKIADAECPNNAELKGQALEKVEGKLQKIAEQLFDINVDPSSPSPKIAQEQQNIVEEAENMKGKLDELKKKKLALDDLFS